MLPSDTPLSGNALALLASSFRPVTADHYVPDSRLERQPVRHARHTLKPPALPGDTYLTPRLIDEGCLVLVV